MPYALYAIRYATREARRPEHFIGGDAHDGPMPMDYFTWVAVGEGRAVVIDTGFDEAMSKKRKRTFLQREALRYATQTYVQDTEPIHDCGCVGMLGSKGPLSTR